MTLPNLEDVHRRGAHMEAARRMGTQDGLPAPTAAVRATEDRLVAGEITIAEALAACASTTVARTGRAVAERGPVVPDAAAVIFNKLGITDPAQLAHAERAFLDVRTFELRLQPVAGRFDFAHFQQINARLLGDVYDWAGQNRENQTQRDDSIFARPDSIAAQCHRIFAQLAKDNFLRGFDASTFAGKAATLGAELTTLHPAIDGNGRTTRLFLEQLGAQAGHPLDFSRFTREDVDAHFEASFQEGAWALRPLVLRAMDAGSAMTRQLASAAAERGFLEPAPDAGRALSAAAVSYLRDPEREALAQHPELAGAFAAERRMRAAAIELGALAPSVEQAVTVRIREHLAVHVHGELDPLPSEGILNAVRHNAATAQLDHVVRRMQEGRGFDPRSSVTYQPGQGISLEQRDWLVRSADDALRPQPAKSPAAAVAHARQAEGRWIAAAIGVVDYPVRPSAFQAPALQALYEQRQRERAAALEPQARSSDAPGLELRRDLAP